jgi:hypothetical protein
MRSELVLNRSRFFRECSVYGACVEYSGDVGKAMPRIRFIAQSTPLSHAPIPLRPADSTATFRKG